MCYYCVLVRPSFLNLKCQFAFLSAKITALLVNDQGNLEVVMKMTMKSCCISYGKNALCADNFAHNFFFLSCFKIMFRNAFSFWSRCD